MNKVILFLLCLVVPFSGFASYEREIYAMDRGLGYIIERTDSNDVYLEVCILVDMLEKTTDNYERKNLTTILKVAIAKCLDKIEFRIEDWENEEGREDDLLQAYQYRNELKSLMTN